MIQCVFMEEFELTYLAKKLPEGLEKSLKNSINNALIPTMNTG